jgi:hypothetical protein
MDYTQHALHLINSDEPLPLDMPAADVPGDMLTLVKKEKASKYRGSRSSSSLVRSSAKVRPGALSSGKKVRVCRVCCVCVLCVCVRARAVACAVACAVVCAVCD